MGRARHRWMTWTLGCAAAAALVGPTAAGERSQPPPWVTVMTEGFEGGFPTPGWSRRDDNGSPEHLWGDDCSYAHLSSCGAWPAVDGADGIPPTWGYYPSWVNSWMQYGPFSLAGAVGAVFEFYHHTITELNGDWLCWYVSVDGTSFQQLQCVSGPVSGGWQQVQVDLSAVPVLGDLTGQPQVWIGFRFTSNGSDSAYQGPWLDDVAVWVYPVLELVMSEIDPGDAEDALEILNAGSDPVEMTGMELVLYDTSNSQTLEYGVPTFTLAAGARVVVHSSSGANTATDLYAGSDFHWYDYNSGAAVLQDPAGVGIDFVRWGDSTVTPPPGTTWSGDNPSLTNPGSSLGRDALGTDTDDGSDWCRQQPSLGAVNGDCLDETVVVNEVKFGTEAAVELRNTGAAAVDMRYWDLIAYGAGGYQDVIYSLPVFTLQPGAYVVIHNGSGTDTATDLYLSPQTLWWTGGGEGAAALLDFADRGVDFARWGGSTVPPPTGTGWIGPDPTAPGGGLTLGRDAQSTDTDSGADWMAGQESLGAANQPGDPIFADGFESGDLSGWTAWSGV